MSLSGARATWANYTLDGITNTDVDFNTYILLPSVDALQEFKVQSGIYPAEFGREAGQVNVSTKPGTNAYHGTAFEFLRNNKLDARNYDFSSATRSATNPSPASTPYRQNQYGFTLGGPVQIPKLFNGKNRLFFMSNFEGFKSRTTTSALATTLTAAMRNGDFSAVPTALQDPLTRALEHSPTSSSSPFPGNQIPANRIDKNSALLMTSSFRCRISPRLPGCPCGIISTWPRLRSTRTRSPSASISTRARNRSGSAATVGPTNPPLRPGITPTTGRPSTPGPASGCCPTSGSFSPTKVNEARFGYNSLFNNITQQLAGIENVDAEMGMPVKPSPTRIPGASPTSSSATI